MSNEMIAAEEIGSPLSVSTIKQQIQVIQQVLKEAMVPDTHYGTIPGTDKPTLLKAGAEKLCLTFRLSPSYDVKERDLGNGHREYEIRCILTHIPSGKIFGEGVGICSTMETKYRYRNVSDFELTGLPIPKDSKEKKAEYRKQGFGMKKVNGVWEWVKYKDSERQENPDIADTYNTVLKMGKKRAHVDAVLTATAASDIFNQDLEETLPEDRHHESAKKPETQTEKAESVSHPVNVEGSIWAIESCESEEEVNKAFANAYNTLYEAKEFEAAKRVKAARDKRLAELKSHA